MVVKDLEVFKGNEMNELITTTRDWVNKIWFSYPPSYFVSVVWNDRPTDFIKSQQHSKHLKNVLLSKIYDVNKISQLPPFPKRLGLMFFQERKYDVELRRFVYHSHIHLYNDKDNRIVSKEYLTHLLVNICSPHIRHLSKVVNDGMRGVDVKDWGINQHRHYNFKDYKEYRFSQDGDLVFDVINTDISRSKRSKR